MKAAGVMVRDDVRRLLAYLENSSWALLLSAALR